MDPTSTRVRLSGRLICQSADEASIVRTHLPGHIAATRAEPGCLSFEVSQSADPLIWHVAECFADSAAFEAHQSRTRASIWWAATAAIGRDYTVMRPE